MMLSNKIQSIMTTDVATLPLGSSFKEAVSRMSEKNISCIIINAAQRPLGIITERDILKIAGKTVDMDKLKVEEVMSSPVRTVSKNMDIYEAAIYLEKNRVRRIVIVDEENRLMGLVTQTDLKNHLGAVYYVKLKTIETIMTKNVLTADEGEKLNTVIQKMGQHDISCLVICKNDKPIGVVTERDITHFIADGVNTSSLCARDIIKTELIYISKNASIYEATNLMKQKHIRRLVVTDEAQNLVGLVAESDLVKHLEVGYLEFIRNIVEKDRVYINTIKEGIFECTPNFDGIITWINQAGASVLGYAAPENVIGKRLKEFFDNQDDLKSLMQLLQDKGTAKDYSCLLKKHNGKQFHAEGTFYFSRDEDNKIVCIEGTLRDVTERKKLEEKINQHALELESKVKERTAEIRRQNKELEKMNAKLQALSTQDGLTGLKNFRYFSEILEMEFKKAVRYNQPLSCIILDIDDFKFINDRFGHTAGDLALIKTAQLLANLTRDTDIVARYGGDEFTIILPNTDLKNACAVGEKILQRFRAYQLKKDELNLGKISLSIGISALPDEKITTPKELLESADKAMYRAKEHGKNNVCI